MNKTVKIVLLVIGSILIVVGLIIGIVYFINKSKNNIKYQSGIEIAGGLLASQSGGDSSIQNFMDDEKYTLDNPMVFDNPYGISPLTSIIIFQTNSDVSFEVYINDVLMTTTESSKKHAIPVYGLIAGKDNIVKLKGSNGKEKEIVIKALDYKYTLNIDKSSLTAKDEFFFLVAPNGASYVALNNNGEVVWYLTMNGAQDLEFLSNGHMLISNSTSAGNESYTGFYEIDYLGKVYKSYTLKGLYHHEVNELSNGNLIVAGQNLDSKLRDSYVYIIDKDSGEELANIDLQSVFESVDENFIRSLNNKVAINNSIDYNENTKELILSLRGFNSVISLNIDSKKINWILGDKKDWSEKFNNYILKSADGSRLPKGAHTAFINKNGDLGLFNNDYDVNSTSHLLKDFRNNYSSATYYKIDKDNMTYKTIWNYVDDDKVFNYALGSFSELPNGHKLVNFGWSFDKSLYNTNATIYDEYGQAYTRLVELDENDNVVFRAKLDANVYRIFKNKFYNNKIDNYNTQDAKVINTMPQTVLDEVSTLSIQDKINNAQDPICNVSFDNNKISMNMAFDTLEDVKIVFKSDLISYIYSYKPANQMPMNNVNLNIKGNYDVFLVIDGKYYKTNTQLNTEDDVMKVTTNAR